MCDTDEEAQNPKPEAPSSTPNADALAEIYPDEKLLVADGFDAAIMGVAWQFNTPLVVYDRHKCIQILMDRDGMDEDEADEFFDFNVQGAFVGPRTPCFMSSTLRAVSERGPDDVEEAKV